MNERFFSVCCMTFVAIALAGCGTTRWTDTSRTGTEQLLLSDAVDRAVSEVNFRGLAGKTVYFDQQFLKDDNHYLISSFRQQLLACGCVLKEKREDAEFVVEARAGAVGTDRHDLLYGVPATNLPTLAPIPGMPTAIPEIPLAKRTAQRGVAKIAVFAYHRESGKAIWQSGVNQVASDAKNTWVFGVGPFQSGSIFRGTAFAGRKLSNPLARGDGGARDAHPVWTTKEAFFEDPTRPQLAQKNEPVVGPPPLAPATTPATTSPTTTVPTTAAPISLPPATAPPPVSNPPTAHPPTDRAASGPLLPGGERPVRR
ncbi:MAG: DUF6655 family protein [Pirellulales bacterium]